MPHDPRKLLEDIRLVRKSTARVAICGNSTAWKVAEPGDPTEYTEVREVALEIQGDGQNGYHLVMSPLGCFTADYWHASVDEALEVATELFGVSRDSWIES